MSGEVFRKRYTLFSSVSNGKRSVDNIRTQLEFNEVRPPLVEGTFFGNDEQGKKLGKIIVNMFPVTFHASRCTENTSYSVDFKGKNIHIESFHTRNETDELCHFECGDLEVLTSHQTGAETTERLLVDFAIPNRDGLRKPTLPKEWLQDENFKDYIDYLEYETEVGPMKIMVNENVDSCIERGLMGHFRYDELVMTFQTDVKNDDVEGVVERAKAIVQDYLDLISMVSQCRTNYYRISVRTLDGRGILTGARDQFLERSEFEQRRRFILYEWGTMDKLLKKFVPLYHSHDDKSDIRESIGLFLAGMHSDYAEAKLIWWQSAIESIVNIISRKHQRSSKTCQCCGQLITKVREKIVDACSELGVNLNDIYPAVTQTGSDLTFPFIKYRNAIVHGRRNEVNYQDIIDEIEREQMLLERLIVNWLGADSAQVPYLDHLWHGFRSY